jgi:hypothetical protein
MTAVEVYYPYDIDNEYTTYNFDVRRGAYIVDIRNNQAHITQRFYAHRRFKNLIVNEIRVESFMKQTFQVETLNFTKLHLNIPYMNSQWNPNDYQYYNLENNPDNITYECRLIKMPTYVGKNYELNDGV